MDLFRNGTDKAGTGQVPFTRQILSEPFVFLSEPFQFFRSCKRAFRRVNRRFRLEPVLVSNRAVPSLLTCKRAFKVSRKISSAVGGLMDLIGQSYNLSSFVHNINIALLYQQST